ncbi:MAG: iron ABC transporter permease [Oscillospiraceae bacterium]|nr:iron ABC transporter permease [Oscillospiraceae bacterium]
MGVGKLRLRWRIALTLLPVAAGLLALGMGRVPISPGGVFAALTGGDVDNLTRMTVFNLRLPRILLAALAGAGLSAAGCAFQSLFANPLATPDTLGVASGASFGAALGLLLGLPLLGVQAMAMVMGAAAVALTWLGGTGKGRGMSSIVLSGIMMGSLFNALVSLVKFLADEESQLPAITYWLMGGLNNAAFETLLLGAPPILMGILILYLLRWRLNLLPLSEDEARASGVNITALRITTVICATAITAACVAMCGQVGWVGLLVPHMCRMKFGSNHLSLLPASVSVGAAFLIAVDTVARSASAQEIPLSILTAVIGAPFFIFLMRRKAGWNG